MSDYSFLMSHFFDGKVIFLMTFIYFLIVHSCGHACVFLVLAYCVHIYDPTPSVNSLLLTSIAMEHQIFQETMVHQIMSWLCIP